jgi:uncharacterized protein (TIGR02246 family)
MVVVEPDSTSGVYEALEAFDLAFASGDADALAAAFAEDAQLLLQHGDAIEGRAAIRAHWSRLFGAYDSSSWLTERRIVDVHGDRAYTLSVYTETLVARDDRPSRDVSGRLVLFLRRDPDDAWRVVLALNSHVRPLIELPQETPAPGSDGG